MAILTVTLNPALDIETTVAELSPHEKLRCTEARHDPGGGEINVARAVRVLGGSAVAVVALNGPAGAEVAELCQGSGIDLLPLPAPGPTRSNMSVIARDTGDLFRFINPGPDWSGTDFKVITRPLLDKAQRGYFVVLSGSIPPGMRVEDFVELASDLVARGARVVADTSGPALAAQVPVLSRTGAGDSFVAAATLALSNGRDWPEVLVSGCCAASASVTTPATELCDPALFSDLRSRAQATAL